MFDSTQTKSSACSPIKRRMARWLENEFFEKRKEKMKLLIRYMHERLCCVTCRGRLSGVLPVRT